MRFVVVSGPPGAGKSTLAVPLAARLGLALIAKDTIKEALGDALGERQPEPDSRRLSAASFAVLFAVAAQCPRAVLEANFSAESAGHLRALDPRPLEIFCRCPLEVCRARFRDRLDSGRRHPVHPPVVPPVDFFARFASPMAVGPVLDVPTDGPVDLDQVVRWIAGQGGAGRV